MTKRLLAIAFIALSLLFEACKQKPADNEQGKQLVTIQHKLGKTEVPLHPKKVVVFDMGTLETFDALNIPVAGIPKDHVPTHLKKYKTSPDVADAGSVLQPNFELVSKIAPDLIIISPLQAKDYEKLSAIAPTIYMGLENDDYKKSVLTNLATIGDIFGMKEQTSKAAAEVTTRIAGAADTISKRPLKAMVLLYNAGTFSTFGSKSRFGFVYNDLKVKPSDDNKEAEVHGTVVSSEYISQHNPDILYIIDRSEILENYKSNKSEIENALIKKTSAYKEARVIYLDPNVWYLSGGGIYSLNRMVDDILKGYR